MTTPFVTVWNAKAVERMVAIMTRDQVYAFHAYTTAHPECCKARTASYYLTNGTLLKKKVPA